LEFCCLPLQNIWYQ